MLALVNTREEVRGLAQSISFQAPIRRHVRLAKDYVRRHGPIRTAGAYPPFWTVRAAAMSFIQMRL
jgi:hypothetical protein